MTPQEAYKKAEELRKFGIELHHYAKEIMGLTDPEILTACVQIIDKVISELAGNHPLEAIMRVATAEIIVRGHI
jgi:hypothetical protein